MSEIPFVNRLGDELDRAIAAGSRSTNRRRTWLSAVSQRWMPTALLVSSSLVVVAVVAVALVLHPGSRRGAPTHRGPVTQRSSATQPDLTPNAQRLVRDYSVLRRHQTAADQVMPGRLGGVSQGSSGLGVISRATAVLRLTRVVTSDGVRVALFVVRMTPVRVVPASAENTAAARRLEASARGYGLWARIYGEGPGLRLVGLAPGGIAPVTGMTAFPAQGGRATMVVPDGVARVRWNWPRLLNPATLTYTPAHSVLAPANHNLAIAPVSGLIPPPTAVWYAADGRVVAVIHNPDATGEQYGPGLSRPARATPQSRQAQRNPATPNKVIISPARGSVQGTVRVLFRVLVSHRRYGYRITGSPDPRCISPSSRSNHLLGPSTNLRGDLFQGILRDAAISCPGTYRVSVYVIDTHGRAYPPFGSASLSVR
jgi:hypothetical protein